MNTNILNKYKITFYTNKHGRYPDGKTALSSYLYTWRDIDDIDDFLSDINLCLNGNFHLVEEPYYNDSMIDLYGELTSNFLIFSGKNGLNSEKIPLVDFKEILLSWKEYLSE